MGNHPIDGLMATAMQSIKEMVDVNTIVGNAVQSPDGSVIIPISKVSFGFAAGGSEFGAKPVDSSSALFGGGSGGGVSIAPVAFMVVGQGQIKLLPVDTKASPVEKILEMVPDVVEKFNSKMQKMKEERQGKKDPVTVEAVFDNE